MRHSGGIWPTTVSQEPPVRTKGHKDGRTAGLQDCRSAGPLCLPYSNIRIRISRHCTFWLLFIYSQRKNVCYARGALSFYVCVCQCISMCVGLVGFRLSKPHTPGRTSTYTQYTQTQTPIHVYKQGCSTPIYTWWHGWAFNIWLLLVLVLLAMFLALLLHLLKQQMSRVDLPPIIHEASVINLKAYLSQTKSTPHAIINQRTFFGPTLKSLAKYPTYVFMCIYTHSRLHRFLAKNEKRRGGSWERLAETSRGYVISIFKHAS